MSNRDDGRDRCAICGHEKRWHFKGNDGRGDCSWCSAGATYHEYAPNLA